MPIRAIRIATPTPMPMLMTLTVSRNFETPCSTSRNMCATRQRTRRVAHSDRTKMRIWPRVARKK